MSPKKTDGVLKVGTISFQFLSNICFWSYFGVVIYYSVNSIKDTDPPTNRFTQLRKIICVGLWWIMNHIFRFVMDNFTNKLHSVVSFPTFHFRLFSTFKSFQKWQNSRNICRNINKQGWKGLVQYEIIII